MSLYRANQSSISLRGGKPNKTNNPVQPAQWVRPSDWLALTIPGAAEQKFVGLIAVFDQASNYVALRCQVSTGTYTVDWGDGTAPQTYTTNTTAEYNYTYSNLSSSTDCSRGYRQAIVTVTPTTAGATFSEVGLNYRHSARSSTSTVVTWLDVAVSAPNATTLRLGGVNSAGTQTCLLTFLEQATIVSHNTTTMANMFNGCRELQSVPLFNTAAVTTMTSMFNDCTSLQSVPLFNTAAVTAMNSMFNTCSSLQSVPLFNTAAVTTMASMFSSCSSLRTIPELTLSAISSVNNNNMTLSGSVTLGKAKLTGMRWTQSFNGCNMSAAELNEMYTALDKLNPNVTNVTGNGTTVTYTVDDITAFVAGRTVTITGVSPVAYNLTNATVATVNTTNGTFTVTNAATGTYVSGGVAAIQNNRTITVTGNPGTATDDETIATNKGWTVTT